MEQKCPGRMRRDIRSEVRKCPQCGRPVEMFSDEEKVRCGCGNVILREAVPSCIQWCAAAEKCLGGVLDVKELKRKLAEKADPDPEYFRRVRRQVDQRRKTPPKRRKD